MGGRLGLVTIAVVLALCPASLVACGGEPAAPKAEAPPPEPEKPPAPEPAPAAPPILLRDAGFKKPESVIHDPVADVYLVSNIGGKALEMDNDGFISRVSPEGKLLELKWIAGGKGGKLHAPKGMALSGDTLYVADIDTVRRYDRASGRPGKPIKIKGATFLNDVTVGGDGAVFVSDSGLEQWGPYVEPNGKDAIYRIDGDAAVAVAKGKELGNPNGIAAAPGGLWVVNKVGEVFRVGADGSRGQVQKAPKGTLDGVVALGDSVLVSSWEAKAVFRVKADGSFEAVATKVTSPADIGYDEKRKRLLIPRLTEHTLQLQELR